MAIPKFFTSTPKFELPDQNLDNFDEQEAHIARYICEYMKKSRQHEFYKFLTNYVELMKKKINSELESCKEVNDRLLKEIKVLENRLELHTRRDRTFNVNRDKNNQHIIDTDNLSADMSIEPPNHTFTYTNWPPQQSYERSKPNLNVNIERPDNNITVKGLNPEFILKNMAKFDGFNNSKDIDNVPLKYSKFLSDIINYFNNTKINEGDKIILFKTMLTGEALMFYNSLNIKKLDDIISNFNKAYLNYKDIEEFAIKSIEAIKRDASTPFVKHLREIEEIIMMYKTLKCTPILSDALYRTAKTILLNQIDPCVLLDPEIKLANENNDISMIGSLIIDMLKETKHIDRLYNVKGKNFMLNSTDIPKAKNLFCNYCKTKTHNTNACRYYYTPFHSFRN